jgi:hypothetical protein
MCYEIKQWHKSAVMIGAFFKLVIALTASRAITGSAIAVVEGRERCLPFLLDDLNLEASLD